VVTPAAKFALNETGYIATFPDVPEAHAQGESVEAVIAEAADSLVAALDRYMVRRRPIPAPPKPKRRQRLVDLSPLIAATLALYEAMRDAGVSRTSLGRKLGLSEGAVQISITARTSARSTRPLRCWGSGSSYRLTMRSRPMYRNPIALQMPPFMFTACVWLHRKSGAEIIASIVG